MIVSKGRSVGDRFPNMHVASIGLKRRAYPIPPGGLSSYPILPQSSSDFSPVLGLAVYEVLALLT